MHFVKSPSFSPRFQPFGHDVHVVLLNPNLPTLQSNRVAKMIVVLDPTLPPIKVLVLIAIKDNGKIKVVNQAVKFVVLEPTII